MESRRLVRIRQGSTLGGVCAGLGAYLRIDPTMVRLFFILLTLAEGIGIVVYLLLWIFLPAEDSLEDVELSERIHDGAEELAESARRLGEGFRTGGFVNTQTATAIGLGLVVIGIIMLVKNLAWLSWLNAQVIFPALMVLAGGVLLYRYWQDSRQ
jgi:phage shock protein PspC (stress-responsive transcriptional regulator)